MRLAELELMPDLAVAGDEIDVDNSLNIYSQDGELRFQSRCSISAPHRDRNQKYFNQNTFDIDLTNYDIDDFESEYLGVGSVDQSSYSTNPSLSPDIKFEYLPDSDSGFQQFYSMSSSADINSVPIIEDLLSIENRRVFSGDIYDRIESKLSSQGIERNDFVKWADQADEMVYGLLVDSLEDLGSLFEREVVPDKSREYDAFVRTIVNTASEIQKEESENSNALKDVPTGRELYQKMPDLSGESQFDTRYDNPIARDMERFVQSEDNIFNQKSRSDDWRNLLSENGVELTEGILSVDDSDDIEDFLRWGVE